MSEKVATTLPENARKALSKAYEAYNEAKGDESRRERKARVVADLAIDGILAGWPMRVLAEPCDITPERLRQIVSNYGTAELVDALEEFRAKKSSKRKYVATSKFPVYDRPAPRGERRVSRRRSELSQEEADELAALSALARQNTGHRPLDSKYRVASEKFSRLIMEYHDRGVIWEDLASATGMTISGVRLRAARHGYGKGAPPSMKNYARVVLHDHTTKEVKPPVESAQDTSDSGTTVAV